MKDLIDPLIDRKRAAELLGVKTGWLDRARAAGQGPAHYEIGGFVRYSVSDLQDWLLARRKS